VLRTRAASQTLSWVLWNGNAAFGGHGSIVASPTHSRTLGFGWTDAGCVARVYGAAAHRPEPSSREQSQDAEAATGIATAVFSISIAFSAGNVGASGHTGRGTQAFSFAPTPPVGQRPTSRENTATVTRMGSRVGSEHVQTHLASSRPTRQQHPPPCAVMPPSPFGPPPGLKLLVKDPLPATLTDL
jgi:hypothetical protein